MIKYLAAALAALLPPATILAESPAGEERVMFAFDDYCIPFQQGLRLKLIGFGTNAETSKNLVVPLGPPGAPDSQQLHFYGTVIEVKDELWMWYVATGDQDSKFRICFARSRDGRRWEKPSLGLVEYAGNRNNNLIDLCGDKFYVAAFVILYEPLDPDRSHRFKMVVETPYYKSKVLKPVAVAYSADGLRWTESPNNPVGPWCEPSGLTKWHGAYYLCGHASSLWTRMLDTYVSYDFEHWMGAPMVGFHRGPLPFERSNLTGPVDGEQVHLGASLWNRGNVIVGFYGQWHGTPTNDRRLVSMDLGLVVSHDALHYLEPIRDFRIVQGKELSRQKAYRGNPAISQGQAFINRGNETLSWYSACLAQVLDGVRLASWERDRLGYLQPWDEADRLPSYVVSEVVPASGKPVEINLNVSGLGKYSQVKVSLLDERFNELPGLGAAQSTGPVESGLRQPAAWGNQESFTPAGPFRVRVDFGGIRPEDLKLYAIYVSPSKQR